ncbi:MAG: hypothetical protein AAGA44_02405 [Pseudomonadota bacterium]
MPDKKTLAAVLDDSSTSADGISIRLVNARLKASPLDEFPGELPQTLREAYDIQSLSINRWPDAVSGWKVGGVPDAFREQYAAERLSGPIFASATRSVSEGGETGMSVFDGGFAAIEAEFVIRTAASIEPGDVISGASLEEYIASVHIGAEIASSPIADINRIGPGCIVPDFGNNAGLVVGPAVRDWQVRRSEAVTVTVHVDGLLAGQSNSAMDDSVLTAFRFLVDLCAERQQTLPEGTLVSCGALSGIHELRAGATATVTFEGIGSFAVAFTKKQPAV